MSDDRYQLTKHDGKTVDKYTDYVLTRAEEILGYALTIVQGSYNKGVGASAGTHDGGGAVDLAPYDWRRKVRVLRELGFAAWYRPAIRGTWPAHIHAVLIGNTKASSSAKAQVLAYRNGRDGLRSNAPDYFWRPTVIKDAEYRPEAFTVEIDPIEWSKWKVTLPTGDKGDPDESASGIPHRPWYGRDVDKRNWLVFRAPVSGVTTENSKYPRCELRELTNGKLASWSNKSGTHTLTGKFQIRHVPEGKPHVVVAQIHDASDDIVMVRYEGGRLFLEADGDDLGTLDANLPLNGKFRLTITAAKGGVTVQHQRLNVANAPVVTRSRKGEWSGLYFKAGAYGQAYAGQKFNGKTVPSNAYSEVAVRELRVVHR